MRRLLTVMASLVAEHAAQDSIVGSTWAQQLQLPGSGAQLSSHGSGG